MPPDAVSLPPARAASARPAEAPLRGATDANPLPYNACSKGVLADATTAATAALPSLSGGPLSIVSMPIPGAPPLASLSTGQAGVVRVTSALGCHGFAVTGTIGLVPFSGILCSPTAGQPPGMPPNQRAATSRSVSTSTAPQGGYSSLHDQCTAKRPRPAVPPPDDFDVSGRTSKGESLSDDAVAEHHPELPETIHSLLSKLSLNGHRRWLSASTQLTPGGRAAASWMELDAHKRCMVQGAVRADEERYRVEQILRDAQIAAVAARRRSSEALRAAEDTLRQVLCFCSAAAGALPYAQPGGGYVRV
jgi:hypothetical protein